VTAVATGVAGSSGVDRGLLARFLHVYPFQPATALFRAVEINQVASRPLPSGVGLDLGCGDGLLTRVLFERTEPRPMVGLDPDPEEISSARGLGLYQTLHVARGNAIPLPDRSCDWVFSNSVLEHVDDIPGIFKEVARVLKPGGRFLFTVPGDQFHDCLGGPVIPGADRDQYLAELDARVAHRRYWGSQQWQARLRDVGLEMTSATRYMTRGELRRWEWLTRMTAGILYGLFRRSKQPIEIQRTLGLRRAGLRMPLFLSRFLAHVIALGLPGRVTIPADAPAACLRIEAEKRLSPQ
jgi:SAM-dependent methyltransferase